MPLRLALTSMNNGPRTKNLLPLLSREEILRRLKVKRERSCLIRVTPMQY